MKLTTGTLASVYCIRMMVFQMYAHKYLSHILSECLCWMIALAGIVIFTPFILVTTLSSGNTIVSIISSLSAGRRASTTVLKKINTGNHYAVKIFSTHHNKNIKLCKSLIHGLLQVKVCYGNHQRGNFRFRNKGICTYEILVQHQQIE